MAENNNVAEVPDHAGAGRDHHSHALEEWIPQAGDSDTEKVRKCNKRIKINETVTKADLQAALRIERFHFYNMTNAHRINSQATCVALLPIIERGDNAGSTPTKLQLNLPLNALKTQLRNLAEDDISTIHNVYQEPSLNDDISLTVRRNNLFMFFFGFGANANP